jgi:geranylgeranyl pyrophosphate synthase
MKGGAILGFAKDEEIEMLGNYGKYLGIAFQIEDDLISSLGEEKVTGKSVSDILKKRKTFMVCYVNTFGQPEYKERLKEILNKKEIDDKDILEIKKIFKETGAIEASKKFINYYTNKATESIKNLKDSNVKTFLIELAYYLANRNK